MGGWWCWVSFRFFFPLPTRTDDPPPLSPPTAPSDAGSSTRRRVCRCHFFWDVCTCWATTLSPEPYTRPYMALTVRLLRHTLSCRPYVLSLRAVRTVLFVLCCLYVLSVLCCSYVLSVLCLPSLTPAAGVLWVVKDVLYPDSSWLSKVTIASGLHVATALAAYWYIGFLGEPLPNPLLWCAAGTMPGHCTARGRNCLHAPLRRLFCVGVGACACLLRGSVAGLCGVPWWLCEGAPW